jgi:hypothetical protein
MEGRIFTWPKGQDNWKREKYEKANFVCAARGGHGDMGLFVLGRDDRDPDADPGR